MWNEKSVSVILMTYNEKDSIRAAIDGYLATGYVDEAIVVNNNAAAGTSEELGQRRARDLRNPSGIWLGCNAVDMHEPDLLILSEPDGTFIPHDFSSSSRTPTTEAGVFGTRTSPEFIWSGANMGAFRSGATGPSPR